MNQTGQMLTFDMVIAAFITLLIIGFAIGIYNNQTASIKENVTLQTIQLDAINSADKIFNDTNCLEFGLFGEYYLSQTKIDCASALDYSTLKERLSLEEYDFYFELTNQSGTILTKGIRGTKRSFPVQRFGVLAGEIVKGAFVLYEK